MDPTLFIFGLYAAGSAAGIYLQAKEPYKYTSISKSNMSRIMSVGINLDIKLLKTGIKFIPSRQSELRKEYVYGDMLIKPEDENGKIYSGLYQCEILREFTSRKEAKITLKQIAEKGWIKADGLLHHDSTVFTLATLKYTNDEQIEEFTEMGLHIGQKSTL